MRGLRFGPAVLIVGLALDAPRALPAQEHSTTFLGLSAGVATKSDYGLSESQGPAVALAFGRAVSRHVALRLDAEIERFGVKAGGDYVSAPCNPQVVCAQRIPDVGDGTISTVALLASAEWYERPDRRWFYFLGGLGPQMLASHPDRPRSVRLAVHAGAGFAIPLGAAALLVEARYQRALGGGAQPPRVVPVSVGLRFGIGHRPRTAPLPPAD